MKLSELILAVGDDNVALQNLDRCAISLHWSRKAGGKITFGTNQTIIPGTGTEQLGLILWLDRKAVASVLAAPPAPAESDALQTTLTGRASVKAEGRSELVSPSLVEGFCLGSVTREAEPRLVSPSDGQGAVTLERGRQ